MNDTQVYVGSAVALGAAMLVASKLDGAASRRVFGGSVEDQAERLRAAGLESLKRGEKGKIPVGAIIWEGPSRIGSGAPVVVIATGIGGQGSGNTKTGPMVQTWILRADRSPDVAVKDGTDEVTCGDCALRPFLAAKGAAVCYVDKSKAPYAIWHAYAADHYPRMSPRQVSGLALRMGRKIRVGSYGDPAAAPQEVWDELLSVQHLHTGYTHQWRRPDSQALKEQVMASVANEAEYYAAQKRGWATFRVKGADDPLLPGERTCPASKEGQRYVTVVDPKTGEKSKRKMQCADCGACGGLSRELFKNISGIAIDAHGVRSRNVRTMERKHGGEVCGCGHCESHHIRLPSSRRRTLITYRGHRS